GDGGDGAIEQAEEVAGVGADELDEQVVPTGADDDIDDLGDCGDRVGYRAHVAGHLDTDHHLAREAEHERVGDGHDLHDPGVEQALYPLPHGCLRQADDLRQTGVGHTAVAL